MSTLPELVNPLVEARLMVEVGKATLFDAAAIVVAAIQEPVPWDAPKVIVPSHNCMGTYRGPHCFQPNTRMVKT